MYNKEFLSILISSFLTGVADGKIIALALRRDLIRRGNVNYAMFYEIFETFAYGKVTGTTGLRDMRLHDAWAFIMRKGNPKGNHPILTPKEITPF